jgi:hypothetical protein
LTLLVLVSAVVFSHTITTAIGIPTSDSVEVAVAERSPSGAAGGAVVPASCPSSPHPGDTGGVCPVCSGTQILGQTTQLDGTIVDSCVDCPAGQVSNADHTACEPSQYVNLTAGAVTVSGTLQAGQTVTFSAQVNNVGNIGASGFYTGFYFDFGADGSWDVQNWQGPENAFPSGLGPGPSRVINIGWVASPGTHRIEICADTGGNSGGPATSDIAESDESDNCGPALTFTVASVPPPAPIVSAECWSTDSTHSKYHINWQSNGNTSANTNYYLIAVDNTVDAYQGCGVGNSHPFNQPYDYCGEASLSQSDLYLDALPGNSLGWWVIACRTDGTCSSPTASTGNTTCPFPPDLTANAPVVVGSLTEGATLQFTGTAHNGGGAAGPFHSFFQIDTNSDGTWDDWRADRAGITGLSAGATSGTITSQDWNASIGTHQVRLCVDFTQPGIGAAVTESNENNNCGPATSFTVPNTGNPYFNLKVNGSATPDPILSGQPFYFTWTSKDVHNCQPKVDTGAGSAADGWWTGGAGVAVGGFLPLPNYGDYTRYATPGFGLRHPPITVSSDTTFIYYADCQSGIAKGPSWLDHLVSAFVALADVLSNPVKVTVTVCATGETVVDGVCHQNPPDPRCTPLSNYCQGSTLHVLHYTSGYPACTVQNDSYVCDAGCDPVAAECILPTAPDALLTASPKLLHSGTATTLTWHSTSTQSCTVTGSNGDTICDDGNVSNVCTTGGVQNRSKNSSALTSQTTYTLHCTVASAPDISRSVMINLVPDFQEP